LGCVREGLEGGEVVGIGAVVVNHAPISNNPAGTGRTHGEVGREEEEIGRRGGGRASVLAYIR
jgi:hypothetical protein